MITIKKINKDLLLELTISALVAFTSINTLVAMALN